MIMQNAPALIGLCRKPRFRFSTFRFASMSMIMKIVENSIEAQQPFFVVRFQYRPYRNGARNAPAIAPQLTPIACAMNATLEFACTIASAAEITMNTTISIRITSSCFFSSMFLMARPFSRSSVTVEEDVSTREDSVDMEALNTRMITIAIRKGDSVCSIVGITLSNPPAGLPPSTAPSSSANSRPKPPRK